MTCRPELVDLADGQRRLMLQVWRKHHPLWLAPHRPFFLLAGLWAAIVPLAWLAPPGLGPEPLSWHRHEMLFGMGGAAVGGYLLTALPAWTHDGAVSPRTTRLLVALWIVGRIAFMSAPHSPVTLAATSCFFLALGSFLSQQAARAKAWRRLPLAVSPFILAAFELLSSSGPASAYEATHMRAMPLFYALLISLVGGRAILAFSRHWGEHSQSLPFVADTRWVSQGAVSALIVAIVSMLFEKDAVAASLAVLSGLAQFSCMLRWRSWKTLRYPALFLLHLAWLWLSFGLVLVGFSLLSVSHVSTMTALHALTMGAMGTMLIAIMGRAAMTRQGSRLVLSPVLALAFALVFLAAAVRLWASVGGSWGGPFMLYLAAVLWITGWVLFLWNFRHALCGEVPRPVLSARFGATP